MRRHGPKSPDSPYETHSTSHVARPAPHRQHQDYPYQHTAATGIEIFIIANADTAMSRPNTNLIKEFYPDVEGARNLGEHDTLLPIAKARRLLATAPRTAGATPERPAHGGRTDVTPTSYERTERFGEFLGISRTGDQRGGRRIDRPGRV